MKNYLKVEGSQTLVRDTSTQAILNTDKKTINQASIKTKDGVTIKIYVSSLVNNPEIKQDQFIWNTANYTDVDLIDNR